MVRGIIQKQDLGVQIKMAGGMEIHPAGMLQVVGRR